MLRIALAQINPVVGAFEANVKKITEAYHRACSEQARLLLTPELGVCGYPPHDLVERTEMFERNQRAVDELKKVTVGQKCALIVGSIRPNLQKQGRLAYNQASVLENGSEVFTQSKTLLPTYDIFDEARYFEPADEIRLWDCEGYRVAISICEDLWGRHSFLGRSLYVRDPVQSYRDQKADLILSLSASPYEWGKRDVRERLHQSIARELKIPLVYVNSVGATDEILFDGGSFALNSQGEMLGRLPLFKSAFGLVSVSRENSHFESPPASGREDQAGEEIEVLARGLVAGIEQYFKNTGFQKAILGLSGGIDSAVVAALAVRALGPENVLGVAMPSQYSSSHSLEDAEKLAKNLGISLEVRPIKFLFSTASREISERRGQLASVALENLQSRLRGVILMTLANHDSALVLTTGNKSELAMGYCTLYGDMAGALAPIGDLFKTRVYELASYINQSWDGVIPERSVTKPPSAELRPNQTDQDTLPDYGVLDEVLAEYIEQGKSLSEIEAQIRQKNQVDWDSFKQVFHRLEVNEYKRRQAAPVLKVSSKAFGIGRRIPIAKSWQTDIH